jgi:hypothetical protein
MTATRRADPDAPLSHERYMSSPDYAQVRGIAGCAVAAKAALLDHPKKSGLLFFLQALSLQDAGFKNFCAEFLELYAERIGTPTMHRLGRKKGQSFSPLETRAIEEELDPAARDRRHQCEMRSELAGCALIPKLNEYGLVVEYYTPTVQPPSPPKLSRTFDQLLAKCQAASAGLDKFIVELCINPALTFSAPGETPAAGDAALPWFKDIIGALYDYKRFYEDRVRREFIVTSIGRKVFDTLDAALATGKMVVIEGESGIGKSTATAAWCQLHLGECRLVSLPGITRACT